MENVFIQAQNELADSGLLAPREGLSSDGPPPDGSPPDGLTWGMGPPVGRPLPEALLARMAKILNIDQQTLENAFTQA